MIDVSEKRNKGIEVKILQKRKKVLLTNVGERMKNGDQDVYTLWPNDSNLCTLGKLTYAGHEEDVQSSIVDTAQRLETLPVSSHSWIGELEYSW